MTSSRGNDDGKTQRVGRRSTPTHKSGEPLKRPWYPYTRIDLYQNTFRRVDVNL